MKVLLACLLLVAAGEAQRVRKLFNFGADELVRTLQALFDPASGLDPLPLGDMYGDVLSLKGVDTVPLYLNRSGDVFLEEDTYNTMFDGQFTLGSLSVRSNSTKYTSEDGVMEASAPVTVRFTEAVIHVYVDTHHRSRETCRTEWLALHLDQVDTLEITSQDPRFNLVATNQQIDLYLSYINKFLSFNHNRAVFNNAVDLCWLVV